MKLQTNTLVAHKGRVWVVVQQTGNMVIITDKMDRKTVRVKDVSCLNNRGAVLGADKTG